MPLPKRYGIERGWSILNNQPGPGPADTVPDPFAFTDVSAAALATLYVSNIITIAGINATTPVMIVGGEYRKNGGAWTASVGAVVLGDTLQVRATSSSTHETAVHATLTVGGVSDTFSITTAQAPADTVPDAFVLEDVSNADLGQVYLSNIIAVAGINAATAVTVAGGEYRKNGGGWTTSAGTVLAGDTLQVRATSSAVHEAAVNVTLTVGGVADTFTITTAAAPGDTVPDAFVFTDVAGADRSTIYMSNIIAVAGINTPSPVSVVGGEYRKNGGAWTSAPGTVANGDTVQVRATSSAGYSTPVNVTLDIGGVSDTYTVTTAAEPAGPVVGEPISITVRDPTIIENVDGEGWVADVEFYGMAVGGVGDMSGAKQLEVVIRGWGYSDAGLATTYDRTLYGRLPLRKPAPLESQTVQRANGGNAIVSYTLDGRVFEGETIVSAKIGASAYVQGATSSTAKTNIATRTNNSSYERPKGVLRFLTPHLLRMTSEGLWVEVVGGHRFGRDLRMYACVEFRVENAAGVDQGISVKSTEMTASQYATGGNPVPVFGALIPPTGLNQGEQYFVRAKGYSWLGGLFDTADFSLPLADARISNLAIFCDKNGTYGDTVAFVKPGVAGGAIGYRSNLAAARATPFPTMAAASAALRIANNAKSGADKHDNANGSTIYLMEATAGAGADHAGFGANTMVASTTGYKTWLNIEKDPAATGLVRIVTGSSKNPGLGVRIRGVEFAAANVLGNTNDWIILNTGSGLNYTPLWVDGCVMTGDATKNVVPFSNFGLIYGFNNTFSNFGDDLFKGTGGSTRTQWAIIAGNHCYGSGLKIEPQILVGNVFHDGAELNDAGAVAGTNRDSSDGCIEGCNSYFRQAQVRRVGVGTALVIGVVRFQNLVEVVQGGGNAAASQISADNAAVDAYNIVDIYNTEVGDRSNKLYTSSGLGGGTTKDGSDAFNIMYRRNTKSDVFAVTNEGASNGNDRTGNWPFRHGVDCEGNVVLTGSDNGSTPGPGCWIGDYPGRNTSIVSNVPFVNAQDLRNGAAGGGDYHLTGETNDAYDRVPVGKAALPFGLDGLPRRNDGTGAAGCYERSAA